MKFLNFGGINRNIIWFHKEIYLVFWPNSVKNSIPKMCVKKQHHILSYKKLVKLYFYLKPKII